MEAAPLTADALLRHEAFVLRLARSLVRNEASAEDIAQETLLSALEHRPHAAGLRSWLARVTRHRALDHLRGEQRRGEREARAAQGEAVETGPSAYERLELEHKVVSAVLSLEEPYRSVVIAAYSEGLEPNEIARRRRVAPGTVRSQLSRALEQLRAKLDRETDGDRDAWSLMLLALVRDFRPSPSAKAASVGSPIMAWPLAAGAVTVLGVAVWWGGATLLRSAEPSTASIPSGGATNELAAEVQPLAAAVGADRVPVPEQDAASQTPASTPEAATAADLPAILERVRALKAALLRHGLEVDSAVKANYAWLDGLQGSGVTRLIDRRSTGYDLDLPGLDGGGSFYSFSASSHDYQTSPQIGLEAGSLRTAFSGQGVVLDLGPGRFRQIATNAGLTPQGLEGRELEAWNLLRTEAEDLSEMGPHGLVTELRRLRFSEGPKVALGNTYLIRAVRDREYDVLVACEVAAVDETTCTLAWRILDSKLVAAKYSGLAASLAKTLLENVSPELLSKPDSELRAEIDQLRGQAESVLLHARPSELSRRFADLLDRKDAGLARLIVRGSPWSELPRTREGGAYYSFATRSHSYDDYADIELQQGRLSSGFAGASVGLVVDLGEVSLQDAAVNWSRLGKGPAFELAANARIDYSRPRDAVLEDLRKLQMQALSELRAYSTEAYLGHSYLVRSISQDHHDLLVVLEVASIDEYGVWIAWQQVASWPVPQDR